MPSAGFEPAILAFKRLQTCALDRTATGIGVLNITGLYKTELCNWVFVHLFEEIFGYGKSTGVFLESCLRNLK